MNELKQCHQYLKISSLQRSDVALAIHGVWVDRGNESPVHSANSLPATSIFSQAVFSRLHAHSTVLPESKWLIRAVCRVLRAFFSFIWRILDWPSLATLDGGPFHMYPRCSGFPLCAGRMRSFAMLPQANDAYALLWQYQSPIYKISQRQEKIF